MTYPVTLTATKGGIDRQRTEGSPSKDVLYDFVNGYRNQSMKAVVRPGSVMDWCLLSADGATANATKGFIMFRGVAIVFSHVLTPVPDGVTCEVIRHPDVPGMPLRRVWFVAPFLQYLYVVVEFINGDVYHYWLRSGTTWGASTRYELGQLIIPTDPNGYVYQVNRIGDPYPLWTANAVRTVGDRIEPTTPDGNYYEVIDTLGANPRSGTTEPVWNTPDGALTYEDVEGATPTTPGTGPTTPPLTPGTDIEDRYDNPGGSRPGPGNRSTQ